MKTAENLHNIAAADREALRAFIRSREDAVEKLAVAKRASATPEATIALFIEMAEQALAVEVIASMVNQAAWDGRISRRNAEWAANIPQAWDAESAFHLHMYADRIGLHKAHLNQLASAMIAATVKD